MQRATPLRPALWLALVSLGFSTGCSSTPSNTQRGAAGGAALGALAGAIIGNNRGSGNAASGAAIGAAAGAIAGGVVGRNQDQRARSATTNPADAAITHIRRQDAPPLPPAPLAESIPAQPSASTTWIPGYWDYDASSNRYVWVSGRWEIPPSNARSFQPPQWRQQGDGYVYVRGYWH